MKNPFKKKVEVKEEIKEEPTEVIETQSNGSSIQNESQDKTEEQISFGKEAAQAYNMQVQTLQVQIEILKTLKEMLEFIKK